MTQGTGKLVGKIAYLEQQPWIMNDTLRANILFGRECDEEYYWKVLSACALTDDLDMWPKGDMTVIGENGMNISGGQRARLALARTVYSKADIYFLDDPLSAVDAIVKRHILDNIILSTGLLGEKLRYVTTNADNILPLCNQVATVDDGHVSVKVQTPRVHTAYEFKAQTKPKQKNVSNDNKELQATPASTSEGTRIDSTTDESNDLIASTSDASKPPKQWSHWSNALYAIRICGFPVVATAVLTMMFDRISAAILDMYKHDVLRANTNPSTADSNAILAYIGVTTLSHLSSTLIWSIQIHIESALINDKFEQKVGNRLIRGLLFAPLSYFESKQNSDIRNDHTTAIRTFTSSAYDYLSYSGGDAVSALLLIYRIAKSSPWLLACVPLFWLVSHVMKSIFDSLNKRLGELDQEEKKDHDQGKSLVDNGTQMIRLFGVEPYFTNKYIKSAENKTRLAMVRSAYGGLKFIVSSTTGTALNSIMLYVYIAMSKIGLNTISSGDVSEFHRYCNSISWRLSSISYLSTNTFKLLSDINEFRNLAERDPEAPYVIDSCRPSAQWPPHGKIEFRDFSMKYGADLNYALKNVNLTINPGEKIGIVGRTGA
ncbi:ATP-binding cassette glutathione S-conjugate transporter ycf1, partial [Coemansia sp. S2]